MKILITGNKGFLGSHAHKYFADQGHTVTGMDIQEDIRKGMPNENFDVLIHFAAYVGGRKGIDTNYWRIAENAELDRIAFSWAEQHCGKILYPSSCAAYPLDLQHKTGTPMQEDTFGSSDTFDLYGMEKLMAERMLEFCKIPSMVVRPFSIYGPGQSMDYPLPAIIERAKRKQCSVWGSGTQTRDWVYIDDALAIWDTLIQRDDSITVNIGTGIPIDFIEVAETIYELIWGERVPVERDTAEPEGASHRYADTTRMKSLGLECPTSFRDGVRNMI